MDLLIKALTGRSLSNADIARVGAVIEAADHHRVLLPLYRAVRRSRADTTAVVELRRRALLRLAVVLNLESASAELSRWLDQAGVCHAIVKGPAVAAAYPDRHREYVDLDVLVDPASMSSAIATLEHHGATVLEPGGWPRPDGVLELTIGLPSGASIDLHCDLIHHAGVREQFRFATRPLLERAERMALHDASVPVLDPQDTLTHVALHAMLSGGDRLLWLADLDALVRQGRIDWPVLVERAREAKLALVVAVMLERASAVLGTPLPRQPLRSLRRHGVLWCILLSCFERRRPIALSYGRSLRGQVLMRSTRSSSLTSVASLVSLLWTDVILFLLRDRGHPWRARLRTRWSRVSR